jgi:hypothetical protein
VGARGGFLPEGVRALASGEAVLLAHGGGQEGDVLLHLPGGQVVMVNQGGWVCVDRGGLGWTADRPGSRWLSLQKDIPVIKGGPRKTPADSA